MNSKSQLEWMKKNLDWNNPKETKIDDLADAIMYSISTGVYEWFVEDARLSTKRTEQLSKRLELLIKQKNTSTENEVKIGAIAKLLKEYVPEITDEEISDFKTIDEAFLFTKQIGSAQSPLMQFAYKDYKPNDVFNKEVKKAKEQLDKQVEKLISLGLRPSEIEKVSSLTMPKNNSINYKEASKAHTDGLFHNLTHKYGVGAHRARRIKATANRIFILRLKELTS